MKIKFVFFVILPLALKAQIGIGTTSPKGMLDINHNDLGLVIPRITSVEDVRDGNGNDPIDGTVVYDISRGKTCFRIDGCWIGMGQDLNGVEVVAKINPNFSAVSTYIKASNTEAGDRFGNSISLSDDGQYLAVGAIW